MKKLLFIFLIYIQFLGAGIPIDQPFAGPSEQLIKRETWKKVEKSLNSLHINQELRPFFEEIAAMEDWGHIGYHGATQQYRIYQDIIRITLEEVLLIPIREDFHFLRIPGDPDLNLATLKKFESYWGKDNVDNKSDKRAKQLLSLNYGIWSNYDVPGSFSLNLFVDNFSKSDIDYEKQLAPFFRKLGIKESALKELFAIGNTYLKEHSGVLLQIGERSHLTNANGEAYTFADTQCYPCVKGGHRDSSKPISNQYKKILSDKYLQKKIDVAPQLRLLCNNQNTLNPFSLLVVRRYDLYQPELIQAYEEELRDAIRELKHDEKKCNAYREMLMRYWVK